MATIGVEGEQLYTLARALCVVLQLGNLIIEPDPNNTDDGSIISSTQELEKLSSLMGVDKEDIQKSLTLRTVKARNEEYKIPLNVTASRDCRDAFSKEIYSCIFDWLVRTINNATCAEKNYSDAEQVLEDEEDGKGGFKMIGLLDIFGFESFKVNRFEQLCINYANEKLQQKFTIDIFSSVQEEYENEGIELGEVNFIDNGDVLNLVEGRMGLISVLNEECVRPRGNDVSFVAKVRTLNKDSDCLHHDKFHRDYEFEIKHYAGRVKYDANTFVQKNMDTIPSDLLDCACKSSNQMISEELQKAQDARMTPSSSGRRRGNLVSQTVSSKFRTQLKSLMDTIGKTRTRYIRCIKPNQQKKPRKMDLPSTAEQLRCAGVVAAVTISRSAFPNRLSHQFTLERFSPLVNKSFNPAVVEKQHDEQSFLQYCHDEVEKILPRILSSFENDKKGAKLTPYCLGKTRVYFRAGALEFLENLRLGSFTSHAILIQKWIRGLIALKRYSKIRRGTISIQSLCRARAATKKYQRLRSSSISIQCLARSIQAIKLLRTLKRNHYSTLIQTHWRMAMAISTRKASIRAVIIIQALLRGARQRPIYRAELAEAKEAMKLENQVKALQRKLEEAERRRIEAEKKAMETPESQVQIVYKEAPSPPQQQQQQQQQQPDVSEKDNADDISKEKTAKKEAEDARLSEKRAQEEERSRKSQEAQAAAAAAAREAQAAAVAAASSAALTAQQQTLIDESGKMLEYLRKEVFKLRSQNSRLRQDFDLLKENNQRLMDANASAGASFQALNQHAKTLARANEKLQSDVNNMKEKSSRRNLVELELKEELKMKQATYIAEVHSRLQYQKTMQRIVDEIQVRCRDDRLVDDILMMSDECESDYMAGPTGMQLSPNKQKAPNNNGLGSMIVNAMSPISEPRMMHTPKPKTPAPKANFLRIKSFLWGGGAQEEEENSLGSDSEMTDSESEDETDSEEEYERRRERMTSVRKAGLNQLQAFGGGFSEA